MIKRILILMALLVASSAQAFDFGNYCKAFPGPAQTHKPDTGSLWIHPDAQIMGAANFEVGFEGINTDGTQVVGTTCEYEGQTGRCVLNKARIAPDLDLPSFPVTDKTLAINGGDQHIIAPDGYVGPFTLKSLELNSANVIFRPGEYWIDELHLNGHSSITIEPGKSVILHFNVLSMNEKATLNNQGSADNLLMLGHRVNQGEWDALHLANNAEVDALIFSRGDVFINGNSEPGSHGSLIKGAVTARNITLRGNSHIQGESQCISEEQSYQLVVNPITASVVACDRIPLLFSVLDNKGVLQAGANGKLALHVTDGHGCFAFDNANTEPGNKCHPKKIDIEVINGHGFIWLGGALGEVNLEATFTPDSGEFGVLSVEGGPYHFTDVGLKFNFGNPIQLVAGKPETIAVQALKYQGQGNSGKCNTNDISGPTDFDVTRRFTQPQSGTRPVMVNGQAVEGQGRVALEFDEGEAELKLQYDDAGVVALTFQSSRDALRESSPLGKAEQKKKPGSGFESVTSEVYLSARPYTFALCGGPSLADVTNDVAFKKAGQMFALNARPVVWQPGDLSGDALKNRGEVALNPSYCNRETTPNFWQDDAPSATVIIDDNAPIKRPMGGVDATVQGELKKAHTDTHQSADGSVAGYRFSNLRLNDVGVFGMRADLADTYLGMRVNPSTRDIGRFYPSHFSVEGSLTPGMPAMSDAAGRGFTYLNQPFDGQYTVYAMTVNNQKVKNYHLSTNPAAFEDWAVSAASSGKAFAQDLSPRWQRPNVRLAAGWQADGKGFSQFASGGRMTVNKGAAPDGPFDALTFAVGVVKPDSDGTDFLFCRDSLQSGCSEGVIKPGSGVLGAVFARGEFLFGRMQMTGFNETQDLSREQTLPVAVEVFDQGRFVTNERDNGSFISTQIGEKELLFSDTQDESLRAQIFLRDDGNIVTRKNVKNGRSAFEVSPPVQNGQFNREQFRYWQKLGEGVFPQPWLQHNWQGSEFDDNPSAIGTFGFYRGSDRVIYKGEKNITLTGE